MNKLLILPLLFIIFTSVSCSREDEENKNEKKILLTRTSTTYTYDNSTMVTEYTYDNQGRIVIEVEDKGTANEQTINYTYDSKGNIAAMKFPLQGSLRSEYTYDDMNRMTSSQKYAADGSKDGKSVYTYYNDRIEELATSKAGNTTKRAFFYTSDKKNIANFKQYDVNGNLWVDNINTYSSIKDPLRNVNPLTPFNASINLLEKIVTVDYDDPASPTTYTYVRTHVANADGNPSSSTETSNGQLKSTTTYEYTIK